MRKENDKANKTKQARTKTKTKTKELQNTAQEAKSIWSYQRGYHNPYIEQHEPGINQVL